MKYLISIILIFITASSLFALKFSAPNTISNQKQLGFQENKGQIVDLKGNQADYVLFVAEADGINIWITTSGITYQFIKHVSDKEKNNKNEEEEYSKHNLVPEKQQIEWSRVDMVLKNAVIKKENIFPVSDITKGKMNYYNQQFPSGIFDVKTYSKIIIKNIYNGIDWVLYTHNNSSLKQDFIVHPNADVSQIKLIYEGDGDFKVLDNQLQFKNHIGELTEGYLVSYQKQKEIFSKYSVIKNEQLQSLAKGILFNEQEKLALSNNNFSYEISIEVGKYNKSDTLIIDPELVWGTFFGGSKADGPMCVESDVNGNIYVCGYNGSANFPVVYYLGAYTQFSATGGAFVSMFTNAGQLLWSTQYSFSVSPSDVIANSLCIDPFGKIFITGVTNYNLPLFNPGGSAYYQNAIGSDQDAFVLCFANNGAALWGTYYGGDSLDVGTSIASDVIGNIFVTGFTKSTNFPTYLGLGSTAYYQSTNNGKEDAFILKFNNAGTRMWATLYGGNDKEMSTSVAVFFNGDICIGGLTKSSNLTLHNTVPGSYFQNILQGTSDGFIFKADNSGHAIWSTYIGGNSTGVVIPVPILGVSNTLLEEQVQTLCVDKSGNLILMGITNSTNFPVFNPLGNSYFQGAYAGGFLPFDNFLVKFDGANQMLWSTYYGGTGVDGLAAYSNLKVDDCNNIYMSFTTASTDIPTKKSCDGGYYDSTLSGISDVFISKFSNQGALLWGTYFGGDQGDFRSAIEIDKYGNLFVTGEWPNPSNANTYPTINPGSSAYFHSSYLGGAEDGFIAKFEPPKITSTVLTSNSFCKCSGTALGNATGGCSPYEYHWYSANWKAIDSVQSIDSLCAGTYYLVLVDTLSCVRSDTTSFTITANGTDDSVTIYPEICQGYKYKLPGGVMVDSAGTYYDTLTKKNGCDSLITINLSVKPSSYTVQNITKCFGETYIWPDGTIATESDIKRDTLVSKNGCDSIIIINLTMNPSPLSNFPSFITIPLGQSVTLSGTGFGTYTWTPAEGLSSTTGNTVVATPYTTTTYCLIINSPNGCNDTACITIEVVLPCPTSPDILKFPNAFSPNGDGLNDEFCVQGYYGCLEDFTINIYNRWGERVFGSKDPNFCWDGIYEGKLLDPQVFVYQMELSYENFKEVLIKSGNISLIR